MHTYIELSGTLMNKMTGITLPKMTKHAWYNYRI